MRQAPTLQRALEKLDPLGLLSEVFKRHRVYYIASKRLKPKMKLPLSIIMLWRRQLVRFGLGLWGCGLRILSRLLQSEANGWTETRVAIDCPQADQPRRCVRE